jgi:hypothetical protein
MDDGRIPTRQSLPQGLRISSSPRYTVDAMTRVPSRAARLARAAKHAELWNAGKEDEWVASWLTICPGEVRMFDPVGTKEKHGFDTATSEAFDTFQRPALAARSFVGPVVVVAAVAQLARRPARRLVWGLRTDE